MYAVAQAAAGGDIMPLSEILNLSVYALVAGLAGIGVLLGFVRGISRQTMKFITVAVAFMVSLVICTGAYEWIHSYLEGKTMLDLTNKLGITLSEQMSALAGALEGEEAVYILAVPLTVVIIPLMFIGIFFVVAGILIVPYIMVCGVLGFTNSANSFATRVLGAILGALQGLLIAVVILVPVAGILETAQEAVTVAERDHKDFKNTQQISELYHTNLDKIAQNPVLNIADDHFGFIYDRFITIDVEGEPINVHTVVDDAVELYVYYGELDKGEGVDYKNLTEENKQIIDQMIDSFGDDKLMTIIVSKVFAAGGKATETGAFQLGIDEPLNTLLTSLLKVFATSDETNIEGDIHTFAEVYYLLSDEGVMASPDIEVMFSAFLTLDENGNSAFKRLSMILDKNPRFAGLSETLSKVAMDITMQSIHTVMHGQIVICGYLVWLKLDIVQVMWVYGRHQLLKGKITTEVQPLHLVL